MQEQGVQGDGSPTAGVRGVPGPSLRPPSRRRRRQMRERELLDEISGILACEKWLAYTANGENIDCYS
ncbi:hypothetical protein KDK_15880 [Dictyobacter kobayashii]|uniref:Uncharacterized protein n=1 Tax=Dictyobacter kobayashii TaxID=2014872 RepID=A0A402AF98_9CHLR|nr:hypothetical protein KDK_15880 [Dictyobacter kobayashii]